MTMMPMIAFAICSSAGGEWASSLKNKCFSKEEEHLNLRKCLFCKFVVVDVNDFLPMFVIR